MRLRMISLIGLAGCLLTIALLALRDSSGTREPEAGPAPVHATAGSTPPAMEPTAPAERATIDAAIDLAGTPPTAPPHGLVGVVVDDSEAHPIESAVVELRAEGTEKVQSTSSDAQGRFRFDGVPAGALLVRSHAPGFLTEVLPRRHASESLTIVLSRGVELRGRVVDDLDDSPIAGASVLFEGQQSVSDATGSFALTVPLSSIARNEVTAPGYFPWHDASASVNADGIVDVRLVRLRAPKGALRTLVVWMPDRTPFRGPLLVDSVAFEPVAENTYRVRCNDLKWGGRFTVSAANCREIWVPIPPSKAADRDAPTDVVLRPVVRLQGVVRDHAGAAVGFALVHVQEIAADDPACAPRVRVRADIACDAEGRFTIDGLCVGAVCLIDARVDGRGVASTLRHVVTDASTRSGLEIVLDPGSTLRGRVIDKQSGAPIANAPIRGVCVQDERRVADTSSDQDGEFELTALPAGISLRVHHAPWMPFDSGVVPTVGSSRLEIALERGLAIDGVAIDERGDPVAGVVVCATPAGIGQAYIDSGQRKAFDLKRARAWTDRNGSFSITGLFPGNYLITASKGALRSLPTSTNSGADTVAAGASGVVLTMIPTTALEIAVVDRSGAAVQVFYASVIETIEHVGAGLTIETGNGRYLAEVTPDIAYDIRVEASGFAPFNRSGVVVKRGEIVTLPVVLDAEKPSAR